jgi:hypothetical protein
MKKERKEIIKEEYAKLHKGKIKSELVKIEEAKDPKKKPDQPNLFGEQDEVYNTIQEEITIVADAIQGCHDAIGKKEDQLEDLQKRSQKLHTAAATVAKIRDAGPKEKAKEKKEETAQDLTDEESRKVKEEKKGASWPAEKKKESKK